MLRRGLLAVPVTLGLMLPVGAHAAETTTGYNQTPLAPTTKTATTPHTTTPTKKAVPSKSAVPAVDLNTPATVKPSPAPATLPFTGLDLRWVIAAGVMLLGMGFTVRFLHRRARSN